MSTFEEPGEQYWKGLEELAGTPEFRAAMEREFPENASVLSDPVTRRNFLRLMGASLALAGLQACIRLPLEKIIPFVKNPEDALPGTARFYATALTLNGEARGALVKSFDGRPIKVEGNPRHPYSLGASDVFMQAEILGLYDPNRAKVVRRGDANSDWQTWRAALAAELRQGKDFRILCERNTSPTFHAQLQRLKKQYPHVGVHFYEAINNAHSIAGAQICFGRKVQVHKDFSRAKVVLSLDDDFLAPGPQGIRHARDFYSGRRVRNGHREMNRLYAVESAYSTTGAAADHRLAVGRRELCQFALLLAQELSLLPKSETAAAPALRNWAVEVAKDLKSAGSRGLICAGDSLPPELHAIVIHMNQALGNSQSTVKFTEPLLDQEPDMQSLATLCSEMRSGKVHGLLILGVNPAYSAPPDLHFAEALKNAAFRARLGLYEDETSSLCEWRLPQTHVLESWGDARAADGTLSLVQPLIEPLYAGKSASEVLAFIFDEKANGYEIVRDYWSKGRTNFEEFWNRSLAEGIVAGSQFTTVKVSPKKSSLAVLESPLRKMAEEKNADLEIHFIADPTVWDGRYSENAWLQELPKPISKLVWSNALFLSPATAKKLGLENEDEVEIRLGGETLRGPIWIQPGQADNCAVAHFGYGKKLAIADNKSQGFNLFRVQASASPYFSSGLKLQKTGAKWRLATTQTHHSLEGRDILRVTSLDQFPGSSAETTVLPTFLADAPKSEYAWGLVTDLSACMGCNACVTACQSENNIPVVGEDQVRRGREMHWLRIDRYYSGAVEDPEAHFQPLACVHCEAAPCEVVCPVAATTHSSEGINQMVYNRCVGTRFCSNNCPYKVRRFNFLQYSDIETESLKLMRNPDVSVRSRGVMEKCSYCIQRINSARVKAVNDGRGIEDGDIKTACQQACPTSAIQFGNINDKSSEVAKLKSEPHNYGLLSELGTKPRSTYLARVRNPNPRLKS